MYLDTCLRLLSSKRLHTSTDMQIQYVVGRSLRHVGTHDAAIRAEYRFTAELTIVHWHHPNNVQASGDPFLTMLLNYCKFQSADCCSVEPIPFKNTLWLQCYFYSILARVVLVSCCWLFMNNNCKTTINCQTKLHLFQAYNREFACKNSKI